MSYFDSIKKTVGDAATLKISEKDLEDLFILEAERQLKIKPIGRQISLNCGRLDVLCYVGRSTFCVAELKAVPLQDKDLAQVLSYVTELKSRHPHLAFIPLLVGPSIEAKYLSSCLRYFEHDDRWSSVSPASYRLYKLDAQNGIQFSWYNSGQKNIEDYNSDRWYEGYGRFENSTAYPQLTNASKSTSMYGDTYE